MRLSDVISAFFFQEVPVFIDFFNYSVQLGFTSSVRKFRQRTNLRHVVGYVVVNISGIINDRIGRWISAIFEVGACGGNDWEKDLINRRGRVLI